MVAVFALAVTVVVGLAEVAAKLAVILDGTRSSPETGRVPTAKLRVTPAGMPLNVNRIPVLFFTGTPPKFESCKLVRKAPAKPSARISEPVGSGTVRFVKIVAVPRVELLDRAPIAKLAIPGLKALITVKLGVVKT